MASNWVYWPLGLFLWPSEPVSHEAQTPSWEPAPVTHGAVNFSALLISFLFFHIFLFSSFFSYPEVSLNWHLSHHQRYFQVPAWVESSLNVLCSPYYSLSPCCFLCLSHGHAFTPGLTFWLHFELLWHFSLLYHLSVDKYLNFVGDTNRLIF